MKYVEIRLKYIEKVYVTDRGSAEIHRKNTKLGGYHFDRSKKFGKKYGNHLAVDHLDFQIKPGMVYGFLVPTEQENLLQ